MNTAFASWKSGLMVALKPQSQMKWGKQNNSGFETSFAPSPFGTWGPSENTSQIAIVGAILKNFHCAML